jgi:plastocyanin
MLVQGLPGEPFTVTFTQPGTYDYICALHENMGMKGTITVLP